MTPAERWGADLRSLLRICNAITVAQLLEIWRKVDPLKKDRSIAVMESACRRTADILRFRPPHIPHSIAVMLMAVAFHTKDPDGVGDTLKIFLFPGFSPSA